MEIRWQRKFRELCEITTFETSPNYAKEPLGGDPFDLDLDRHKPAERLGMYTILQAFGFDGPFDDATVLIADDTNAKLADAIGAFRLLQTGKRTVPADPIKSAQELLTGQWLVRPNQINKRGDDRKKYKLNTETISNKYGMMPAPEHLARYKAFTDALRQNEFLGEARADAHASAYTSGEVPTEFRAFTTPI